MINDVARAFFEAKANRQVCVELPAEALTGNESNGEWVAMLEKSLYGTRDAAFNFQRAVKKTLEAMTKTLAVEWANRDVLVNCIAPGYIGSSGLKRYPVELGILQMIKTVVPLKRLGTRNEIAWMAAYLASPAGAYITGQTVTIDGGKELWGDLWPISDPPGMGPAVPELDPWEEGG